ncbi:conserved exported hypothetical protein [Vibrio owensii]|uniref:PEP-CTERM sorting domain-containing protein n=1 Tax=Vibrio owensii TaxID=696485 RepID=A0AAU9Q9T5_9VIBR|nr:conserved exported hypothetical protein [Vibrio owensii]
MKKHILFTTALAALSMQVAANPAQQTVDWVGIVPGSFLGSDIGIAAPDGGELRQGLLLLEESGVFGSTTINARAFSLLEDGSDIDPETPYPDAVNWYVDNMSIEHGGVEGNAYSNDLLEVYLDGNVVTENELVNTPAGAPNMTVSVSYSDVPTGKVTSLDRVRVTGMLFAEGAGGGLPLAR